MTNQIFRLLIHLPNQINQFPQVSIHSMPPAYSLVPLSLHTVSLKVISTYVFHTAEWHNLMARGVELDSHISSTTHRLHSGLTT